MLKNNSRDILREAELQTGVSKSTIQRYFQQELGVFSYNLQMGSQVTDQDTQAPVHFAEYSPSRNANGVEYLKRVMYSD